VASREREYESISEYDPHDLLFGDEEDSAHDAQVGRVTRADRHHRQRVRRSRRTFSVIVVVVVVVLAAVAVVGVNAYEHRYHPADFAGAGTGTVRIVVKGGDGSSAIGGTLARAGVVASSRAFVNAASKNNAAQGISPGTYQVRKHMSASNALTLLLDPSSRLSNQVVVFEGATVFDVEGNLAKALGVPTATITAALKNVDALNLPNGYTSGGQSPQSVEGFLYPATYSFDPGTSPGDAIGEMITKFIDEDRTTGFADQAAKVKLSPYQALIIASIAEKEAKNPADYPKVARVILNRIKAHMPLQIDATSAYAAKQLHLDPTKVIYAQINSPYNTYTHDGLPPTPIANPGPEAIDAAVTPATGDWLYYVNGDKAGDLFFTSDQNKFAAAVDKCRTNNWGCG
jgi:UPF0755 protein